MNCYTSITLTTLNISKSNFVPILKCLLDIGYTTNELFDNQMTAEV